MRIGSLFSGAGGLDMAVEQVFGGEVIWQAEVDKAASKVLAYRFPCAPNLGDITQIDWKTVEPPDVLCGGFPCQDVSAAGKRAGIKDGTRSGLWSVFADAIDQLRPPLVVIENVRGLLSAQAHRNVEPDEGTVGDRSDGPVLRALGAVLGDLSDLGYDAQWTTVAASSVGAPHRRERVFIVATDTREARWRPRWRHEKSGGNRLGTASVELGRPAAYASDSSRDGWDEGRPEPAGLVGGFDAAVSGDEPGVVLLPTPTTSDSRGAKCGGAHDENVRVPRLAAAVEVDLPKEIAPLPTPCAQDGNGGGRYSSAGHQSTLPSEVRLLPTPQASDSLRNDCAAERNQHTPSLVAIDHYLPTPTASDATGGGAHPDTRVGHSRQLIDFALLNNTSAWGKYEPAIRRWEKTTGPAPSPTEPNKNGNPRLSAAFSEWMMGWPHYWVTDPDIGISRNDQLKIIGNGVCPQQAIAALRYLLTVSEVAA